MANHATPAPDAQPPTEILRRAAKAIRKDQDIEENLGHICPPIFAAWLAVADWLDACALVADVKTSSAQTLALRVARAYLGEGA